MSQKYYKAIAEINKKQLAPLLIEESRLTKILEQDKKAGSRKAYWATKQLLDRCTEKSRIVKGIIFAQANYFEKEFEDTLKYTEERFKKYKEKHDKFNREQFLEWCGVKK